MVSTLDKHIWRTCDVEAYRGFEYYRDGICQSFMDLTPEPEGGDDWVFSGSVETMPLGAGRLNRVVATSHLVLRTKAEISRSPAECFYLNYKTRGECRIGQRGQEVVIRPGDVGLFDSTQPFALEHRRESDLAVSSFMLPFQALRDRLPDGLPCKPLLISGHPTLGYLVRETAATFAREAERLDGLEATRLFDMLLDLVAMAIARNGQARVDTRGSRGSALLLALKTYVDDHHARTGLDAKQVADAFRLSVRYLHRLFEQSPVTFGDYLISRRLESGASALTASGEPQSSIAAIALASGFADPAHFQRAFKARYGCTPGDWRRRGSIGDGI